MPKINETFVKRLAAPDCQQKRFPDDEIRGFAVRVTRGGAKSFVLNYTLNHHERRYTIGRYPDWTAAAAREKAKELRRLVDQGVDPLQERVERREAPTVEDLWGEYQKHHLPSLSNASQRDQRSMWQRYILPELRRVPVCELTSRQTDALHATISQTAPTRANRVLEVLRKALNLAVRWEWIARNPVDGFQRNAEHSRERYLTEEEYALVFAALGKMPNQKAADAIRLLILTGARRGEVLRLAWADLDLERGLWNRPAHKSKDRRAKRIPLSTDALALLLKMRKESKSDLLFPTSNGTPLPDLNRPWRWLKRETGLQELRIHDLRHSFASLLVSSGETFEMIGKLLGHSQAQTTMRYAHLADDPVRRAANVVGASLASR